MPMQIEFTLTYEDFKEANAWFEAGGQAPTPGIAWLGVISPALIAAKVQTPSPAFPVLPVAPAASETADPAASGDGPAA